MANDALTEVEVTLALLDEMVELADATFLELDANIVERSEKLKQVNAAFAAARSQKADTAPETEPKKPRARKAKAA